MLASRSASPGRLRPSSISARNTICRLTGIFIDVVVRPARVPFVVKREADRFRVTGPGVERWVAEADLDDEADVAALQRRLVRAGVERRLAEAGAHRGDEVVIGQATFDFQPDDQRDRAMPDTGADGSKA